jgi:hypothetical protein
MPRDRSTWKMGYMGRNMLVLGVVVITGLACLSLLFR